MVRGENVFFPLKEFELLEYLMQNKGRVMTRHQLIDRIWGSDYVGDTNVGCARQARPLQNRGGSGASEISDHGARFGLQNRRSSGIKRKYRDSWKYIR